MDSWYEGYEFHFEGYEFHFEGYEFHFEGYEFHFEGYEFHLKIVTVSFGDVPGSNPQRTRFFLIDVCSETPILFFIIVMILVHHPIETTIKNWLFTLPPIIMEVKTGSLQQYIVTFQIPPCSSCMIMGGRVEFQVDSLNLKNSHANKNFSNFQTFDSMRFGIASLQHIGGGHVLFW